VKREKKGHAQCKFEMVQDMTQWDRNLVEKLTAN